jgi:fumarate reductase subunit C
VAGYIIDHYYFRFDRGVVHIVVAGDRVDHYCLMFSRVVVHIVVAVILLTITVSCLTEEWFILLWLVILLTIYV